MTIAPIIRAIPENPVLNFIPLCPICRKDPLPLCRFRIDAAVNGKPTGQTSNKACRAVNNPTIDLDHVHLTLGSGASKVHILRGIGLRVGAGEAVGLVGPSGSGKSTLLMVTAGLERADAGTVRIAGEDIGRLDEDALARFRGRNIGIVFQSFHLVPNMTALENVAIPLELTGTEDAHIRARRELESVGLGDRLSHYPAELSGGEQQRVAIARA
ncbi:MAG: ATP-binding cassette domain-containing protein, partial [Hyphomicrobiales bacterium]|nr:ATP-binding cassette domain-containing protein [Hyphomicrobiales bacterium]